MRHRYVLTGWLIGLFLLAPTAGAQENDEDRRSFWDKYTAYFDDLVEKASGMDLYGVTAQLPEGIFKFKVDYNHRRAAGRYNGKRQRTQMVEPISFGDDADPLLMLDLGASGGGEGVTLQFSYGITDPLDFYFEITLINLDIEMRPKLRKLHPDGRLLINGFLPPGYPRINENWFEGSNVKDRYLNEAAEWFLNYLPRLGRPSLGGDLDYPPELGPGKGYHSAAELADINLGFSWNFYRSDRWSGAFTGRVYFPTGSIANPNNSLTLGTGPKVDWGTGSFGVGFTQGYDIRIYKYKHWIDIVLSTEFTAAYYFQHHRRYPDFPKPTADGNALLDILDPERQYFPDMHDLVGKNYEYTPGFGAAATLQLGVQFLLLDFGIGIGYQYVSEPELDADLRFENMVRSLELQLAGHYEMMDVAVGFTLVPLYIPLSVHYKYQKNIGGRNTLIFDENHSVIIEGVIPLLW